MELPPRIRHEHARDEDENDDATPDSRFGDTPGHQGDQGDHDDPAVLNGAQPTDPGPRARREHAESPLLSMNPRIELEPGWVAANGLERNNSDELLALMLRPSFRPARELDLVPVAPCGLCLDGGLRTAGTVRTRHGRQLVRACDTCGAVVLGVWQPWQHDRYATDA